MIVRRYRFVDKEAGCFHISKNRPYASLRRLFSMLQPGELRNLIKVIQKQALSNEMGCYSKAMEKERLVFFCDEFLKLADAMYVMNIAWRKRKEKDGPPIMETGAIRVAYPRAVIVGFFLKFSPRYIRAELLDLLEAATGGEDESGETRSPLVLTYRLMGGLSELALQIYRNKKK